MAVPNLFSLCHDMRFQLVGHTNTRHFRLSLTHPAALLSCACSQTPTVTTLCYSPAINAGNFEIAGSHSMSKYWNLSPFSGVIKNQDDYKVVRKIGKGKYSEIFEGINVNNNERCVIKILKPVKKKKQVIISVKTQRRTLLLHSSFIAIFGKDHSFKAGVFICKRNRWESLFLALF